MRIAVNTQHLLPNKLEGIGWFAHETLRRIVQNHPEHEFVFIFDRPWDEAFIYSNNIIPVKTTVPSRHPFLWWWHYEIDIPLILKKYSPDLFFSPDGWMSLKTPVPTVNVIHDLNFVHRPSDFPFFYRKYYNYFFPKYAKKAKQLITVSEYSKTDIIKTWGIAPKKIDVAYNGCNTIYTPVASELGIEIENQFTGGNPYFIYVGSHNPRKNIEGMLDAFDIFKQNDMQNYKLVIVGEAMWNNSYLQNKIDKLNYKDDIVFTGRLSTEVLHLVLASAKALLLVSFSEGFGIPVVEAMHCDVPVICSNVSALPEIAGNAALFADPFSANDIAQTMITLANNTKERQKIIEEGKNQRKKFSWDYTAEKVWETIEKACH